MVYHLLPGYRVHGVRRSRNDHWQGGRAYHNGATCPVCKRAFLLLWDLNAQADELKVSGRSVFRDLDRLPLYYCWTCCAEMDYQVIGPKQIKVWSHQGTYQGDDFPYKRYPTAFQRSAIDLERLDQLPARLKKLISVDLLHQYNAAGRKLMRAWLGRRVDGGFDLWCHQIGGMPWLMQGPERIPCPNTECAMGRRGWTMKLLAAIHNDPIGGLPMVETRRGVAKHSPNNFVQVVYHICKGCLTIHAANRCD